MHALTSLTLDIQGIPCHRFSLNNFIWLLFIDGKTICIDPGEAKSVKHALTRWNIKALNEIWITHRHFDHLAGVSELVADNHHNVIVRGPAAIYEVNHQVSGGDCFSIGQAEISVWHTPGHTMEHVIYIVSYPGYPLKVFCGDLLFMAGCGRVIDGSVEQLFASINRLNQLPGETQLYFAHDYGQKNIAFAQQMSLLSKNKVYETNRLLHTVQREGPHHSLMAEREINSFLQVTDLQFIQRVCDLIPGTPVTPLAAFTTLRQLRDQF